MGKKIRNIPALQRWVAALRSRSYRQGRQMLHAGRDQYGHPELCCLGVACKVMGFPLGNNRRGRNYDNSGLTPKERKILGITLEEENTLVTLNDEERAGFKRIATYIEKNIIGG